MRSSNDHHDLRVDHLPVRALLSSVFSVFVAATWQQDRRLKRREWVPLGLARGCWKSAAICRGRFRRSDRFDAVETACPHPIRVPPGPRSRSTTRMRGTLVLLPQGLRTRRQPRPRVQTLSRSDLRRRSSRSRSAPRSRTRASCVRPTRPTRRRRRRLASGRRSRSERRCEAAR